MKLIPIIPASAIGLALALSACSGEAATADEDATAETADDDAAPEHDTAGYAEDATDGMVDAGVMTGLNEKLASFHSDSGHDIHVITAMTTDGRDIEEVAEEMRTERGADALIYVAGEDQALAIVGEGLDDAFTGDAELAMIAHFEENELAEGLNSGVDAIIARLSN